MPKLFVTSLAAIALLSASAMAATDLEQEYAQVRKIALKDPKVREGFEKASEHLDEKILEIDPSLKPIVEREKLRQPPYPEAAPRVTRIAPRPAATAAPVAGSHEHIVLKGETLSSIAAHDRVKVAALEKANHITDDRKLRVGQKLVIPSAGIAETPAAEATPKPTPKQNPKATVPKPTPQASDDETFWDKVKKDL